MSVFPAVPFVGEDLATLRAIRNKLSAGDLPSAKSLLEDQLADFKFARIRSWAKRLLISRSRVNPWNNGYPKKWRSF